MIIDAMDLLYTNRFDGFCLVSSDSDLTRLASRIRESGLVVYGFGERKTPKPFVSACDKFIYFENLKPVIAPIDPPTPLKVVAEPPTGVPATLCATRSVACPRCRRHRPLTRVSSTSCGWPWRRRPMMMGGQISPRSGAS